MRPVDCEDQTRSAFDSVVERQARWARGHGARPDDSGYLPGVADNLFAPLSAVTDKEFRASAGSELDGRNGEPAKMRALHSSSALVCNVFDYWRVADIGAIARALGIPEQIAGFRFEAQLPTGLAGTPPTLDLLLEATASRAWAVESKFTEPYQGRSPKTPFADSYFRDANGLWAALGLPRCQALAERVALGQVTFVHLDAAQLLKHALGLRRRYREGRLFLLWYPVDAAEARVFANEIRTFAEEVDPTLGFQALRYHDVFARLAAEPAASASHVAYLRARYFGA